MNLWMFYLTKFMMIYYSKTYDNSAVILLLESVLKVHMLFVTYLYIQISF